MNAPAVAVLIWAVGTLVALFVQLIPGVPPIGYMLYTVGAIPACIVLFFFARFSGKG